VAVAPAVFLVEALVDNLQSRRVEPACQPVSLSFAPWTLAAVAHMTMTCRFAPGGGMSWRRPRDGQPCDGCGEAAEAQFARFGSGDRS
jgi:hypothetical protein